MGFRITLPSVSFSRGLHEVDLMISVFFVGINLWIFLYKNYWSLPSGSTEGSENILDIGCELNDNNSGSEVPDGCPGIASKDAGKNSACDGCPNKSMCSSGEAIDLSVKINNDVKINLQKVTHKILILSGKGGVGKSTICAQLAWGLVSRNYSVGVLDIDICGPSIPKMTGTTNHEVHKSASGWEPVYADDNLAIMSIGFLLPQEDDAVIWRGPKKNALIKQFLTDVDWGSHDFLLIDTPPGTSDEHLSVISYLKNAGINGAIIVTTPQEVSLQDVRKEINFCKKLDLRVLGVVENMTDSVFSLSKASTRDMCSKMEVPYAISIPLDPSILLACENGESIFRREKNSPGRLKMSDLVDFTLSSL